VKRYLHISLSLAACALLSSCAGYWAYDEGRRLMFQGDGAGALAKFEQAVKASPDNRTYRDVYERERKEYVERLVGEGDMFRNSGELDRGEAAYLKAQKYAPNNDRVRAGLAWIQQRREDLAAVRSAQGDFDAGRLDEAEKTVRAILAKDSSVKQARDLLNRIMERRVADAPPPSSLLPAALSKPITLEFRDVTLKSVFSQSG